MKPKMFAISVSFLVLLLVITSFLPSCSPRPEISETPTTIPIPTSSPEVNRMVLNDHSLWGGNDLVWASVSVKDTSGRWVTGLNSDDFELSEMLLSPSGEVMEQRKITFDQPDYQFEGDGFWERSVTDEKLDIVFLVDSSGSMEAEMPGIHSELNRFVDRLQSEHTDFRLAVMKYDWSTEGNYPAESYGSWAFTMPFRGVMESDEIHQWLDNVQLSWGEWWLPAASYDRLMDASQLDFREGARKVVVVITDSIADNIYGSDWYAPETTANTLSAVELLLKDKDIEVLYSQPDEGQLQHLEGYTQDDINPRAKSGFDTLGERISWPFHQEDIKIDGGDVTGSQYFFAWMSHLDIPDPRQDYKVRVVIKTAAPEQPGEFLEESFAYVPEEQEARLVITVIDEAGNPTDDVAVSLMREMGDRRDYNRNYSQLAPEQGVIVVDDIPLGKYYLHTVATGDPAYSVESLRYAKTSYIEVPETGLELSLRVETGDREIELAKARGLLQDLDDWHSPGDPFRGFVDDAGKWLDDLEENGITWQEMVAIKRFYIDLSGYANVTEYSQRMIEGATQNFYDIVQDFRDIVGQITAFKQTREQSFGEILASALLEVAYDILTTGDFTAAKEAVEAGLEELYEYAENELLPELIEDVMEQIPDGTYKPFIGIIINTCLGADFESWDSVIETGQNLLLAGALDEIRGTLADGLTETMFTGMDLDTPLEKALVSVVGETVAGLLEGGFENFAPSLQKFARDVGLNVLEEGRESVVVAVSKILHEAEAKLEPGDMRDFLFGMAEDLILEAIPSVKSTPPALDYSIDSDSVVRVLVKYSLYYVILKKYYVDEACQAMYATLERARSYVPAGESPDDWEHAMIDDFYAYREIMGSLQDYAWTALSTQEDIEEWAQGLQGLVDILDTLADALDVLANFYPPFEDEAQAVHGFIAVLDGIQVIPRAIEFGLRIDCLDTFGDSVEPLSQAAFPEP